MFVLSNFKYFIMGKKSDFKIITYKNALQKGVPVKKEIIKSFTDIETAEKELQKQFVLGVSPIHLIDEIKQTKTLYFRSLGAKNYCKKQSKL
jgi:phage regulator Rha-like protein